MGFTINVYNHDRELASKISKNHGLGILAGFMLLQLGITSAEEIQNYIDPDPDLRISPYAFSDMKKAVTRIRNCIENKNLIFVYGDKDVDGVTSVATVVNFLIKLGLEVKFALPVQDEGYGISKRAIQEIISSGAKVVITVDVGIKEIENVKILNEHGIDVIITDHHEPDEDLPPAYSILNVKCEKNFPAYADDMSGCATAFKLCEGILLSYWDEVNKTFACFVREGDIVHAAIIRSMNIEKRLSGKLKDFDFSRYDYIIVNEGEKRFFEEYHNNVLSIDEYFKLKTENNRSVPDEILNKVGLVSFTELEFLINSLIKAQRFILPSINRFYYDFVDLAGISTVCDVMPLTGENRILVKQAEKKLQQNGKGAIDALNLGLNFFRYNEPVTAKRIGNYLGPCINSAGRMGKANIALELLLDSQKQKIQENVKQLINLNNERKKMADMAFKDCISKIGANPGGNVIIYRTDNVLPGITGIFAQKLAHHYERPAFVFTSDGDSGDISGSGRAPDETDILNLVKQSEEYLLNYGGHLSACGLRTTEENFENLIERLKNLSSSDDYLKPAETVINIIAETTPDELTMDNVAKLWQTGPFGQGTPEPYFLLKNAFLGPVKKFGKPPIHARFKIHGNPIAECLGWGMADLAEDLHKNGVKVDIVFEPEINYYNGKQSVQLNVVKLIKKEM